MALTIGEQEIVMERVGCETCGAPKDKWCVSKRHILHKANTEHRLGVAHYQLPEWPSTAFRHHGSDQNAHPHASRIKAAQLDLNHAEWVALREAESTTKTERVQ